MFPATFHHVDFSFEVNFQQLPLVCQVVSPIGTNDLIRGSSLVGAAV